MLKTSTLMKIFFREMFKQKPGKKGKKTNILLVLGIIFAFYLVLLSFIYRMSFNFTFEEDPLTKTTEVLSPLIVTITIMSFFFTLIGGNTLSIGQKEMNIIAPLPIKEGKIITAKLLVTIITESVYELMIGLSTLIAMLISDYAATFSIVDYMSIISVTFLSTLFPITLTSFLFLVIGKAIKKSKHANKIETIFSVLLVVLILVGSFTSGYNGTTSSLIPSKALNYIPFVFFIKKALDTQNILYVFLYLLTTIGLFIVFVFLFKKFAYRIMFFEKYSGEIKKETKIPYKQRSMLKNLLKREYSRIGGSTSSIFVTNVLMPPLIMPLMMILMLLMPDVKDSFKEVDAVSIGAIIMLTVTLMSSIMATYPSFGLSLDWRFMWILKSTPIKTKDILLSKAIFNISIILIACIPASILFLILGMYSVIDLLFIILYIFVASLTFTLFELYLGLKHPRTGLDDQIIIKQSPSVLISVLLLLPTIIVSGAFFTIPLLIPAFSSLGMIAGYISLIFFTALYGLLWFLLLYKKSEKLFFNFN